MENRAIEQIANDVLIKYVKRGGVHKAFDEIMIAEGVKFRKLNSINNNFVGDVDLFDGLYMDVSGKTSDGTLYLSNSYIKLRKNLIEIFQMKMFTF